MNPNAEFKSLSSNLDQSVFYQIYFLLATERDPSYPPPSLTSVRQLICFVAYNENYRHQLLLLKECLQCIHGNESTENVQFRVPVYKRFLLEVAHSLPDYCQRCCAEYFNNCVSAPDIAPMELLLSTLLEHIKNKSALETCNVMLEFVGHNYYKEERQLYKSARKKYIEYQEQLEAKKKLGLETSKSVGPNYSTEEIRLYKTALEKCIKYQNQLTTEKKGEVDPIQWLAKKTIAPDPEDRMLFYQIHFLLAKDWTEPNLLRSTTVQNIFQTKEKSIRLPLLRECLHHLGRKDLLLDGVGLFTSELQIDPCIIFLHRIAKFLGHNHKLECAIRLIFDINADLARGIITQVFDPYYNNKGDAAYPPLETLLLIFLAHRLPRTSQCSTCNIVITFVEDNYKNRDHSQFTKVKSICDDFKTRYQHPPTAFDSTVSFGERVIPLLNNVKMDLLQELTHPNRMMWDHEVFLFISYYVCRGRRPTVACLQPSVFSPQIKANDDAVDADLMDWISDDWETLYIPYQCRCSMDHRPSHWVLFIVDKINGQVLQLDTLEQTPSHTGETLFDIDRILHKLIPSREWNPPRIKSGLPIQVDNVSCGKWVCYLVQQHSLGQLKQVYNMTFDECQKAIEDITKKIIDMPPTAVQGGFLYCKFRQFLPHLKVSLDLIDLHFAE